MKHVNLKATPLPALMLLMRQTGMAPVKVEPPKGKSLRDHRRGR